NTAAPRGAGLPDPQGDRALEDIALHRQLRVLPPQPDKLGPLALAQPAVATLPGPSINRGPAPQSGLVDPQLPGHLRDRLACLPHDPHRASPELLIKLSPRLGHLRPPWLGTPPRYEGQPMTAAPRTS